MKEVETPGETQVTQMNMTPKGEVSKTHWIWQPTFKIKQAIRRNINMTYKLDNMKKANKKHMTD